MASPPPFLICLFCNVSYDNYSDGPIEGQESRMLAKSNFIALLIQAIYIWMLSMTGLAITPIAGSILLIEVALLAATSTTRKRHTTLDINSCIARRKLNGL